MRSPASGVPADAAKCPQRSTESGDARFVAPIHVLVADDDAGSRRFLHDGLAALGARVATCANGYAALERARAETFDLLLLDCRMPGAGALEILSVLREEAAAYSADTVAIATTAELAPEDEQRLLGAGFSEILMKPCGMNDLQRVLALPERQSAAILDDHAALLTSGDATTMRALRRLLRDELAVLLTDLESFDGDRDRFADRLHRLRSSCGFCGAATLSNQTALLQRQLARAGTAPISLGRFRHALLATVMALDR